MNANTLTIAQVHGGKFGVYSPLKNDARHLLQTFATREQAERYVARIEAVEARKAN